MASTDPTPARIGRTGRHRGAPDALDPADLARWGIFMAALVLGGLVLASRAGDDYMYVCGLLFVAFGLLVGLRLLGRWTP